MFQRVLSSVILLGLPTLSLATQWQADDVEVSFLTTKVTETRSTVTELNSFEKATATVNFDGKLDAVIDLNSVDSGIDIRDERLQKIIFAAAKDRKLLVSGKIDLAEIDKLKVGQSLVLKQPLHLTFAGKGADVTAELLVTRQEGELLSVTTLKPILLDLTLFGVDEGVNQLTELAGLQTIALQVPTLLHTTFHRIGN